MFDLTEPRPVHFTGATASASVGVAEVRALGVIGTLFRGEIRQLCFDAGGDLLVLAGRGVRRLDPRTLAETGRWLPEHAILAVHPCGERLWVVTDEAVFLAAFGGELGEPFAAIPTPRHHHTTAAGTRLALPHARGVTLLDAATGTTREYLFDAAWFAALRSTPRLDRALLSPSGRSVGVTLRHGYLTGVWDVETGAPRLIREHAQSTALVDDERLLHVHHQSGSLVALADGAWSRLPADVHFEDAQVRGDRLLVADPLGGFSLYEAASMTRLAGLDAFPHLTGRFIGQVGAAVSATHVATYAAMAGVLRVTELGGATVQSSDWLCGPTVLSLGQGGRRVGVFREWIDGRLECIDLDQNQLIEVSGHHQDITDSAITGDGQRVVVPCGSILRARTVHVAEFGAAESTESHQVKSCVRELVPYKGDAYAVATYTLNGSGYVGLHTAGVARALAKVTEAKESPWRIAVGHTGEELFVAWESAAILYDIRKRPKVVTTWKLAAGAVALGPPGFLAFVHAGDQLCMRTTGSPQRVLTVVLPPRRGHGSPRLAFSRDGSLLFVGASDGVLEVRRSDDGSLLRELPLHHGGYAALQCCGEAIWTMGDDGLGHVVGRALR